MLLRAGSVVVAELIAVLVYGLALDNIEGEALVEFHAGRAQDRAQGTRGAALLSDHFTDVTRRYMKTKYGRISIRVRINMHRFRMIHQCSGNFAHERLDLGDGCMAVLGFNCVWHCTPQEKGSATSRLSQLL